VFLGLGLQHALRLPIFSSVSCPALQYFSMLSHKLHESKKKLLNTRCVLKFSLQRLSETLFILSKTERDVIEIVCRSSCNVPVNLVRFFWDLNFLYIFPKNTHLSNFTKIRPVGADVFHANKRTEGQADMTNLIDTFCNFANASKEGYKFCIYTNSLIWSLYKFLCRN
jgi:hypothetical protein